MKHLLILLGMGSALVLWLWTLHTPPPQAPLYLFIQPQAQVHHLSQEAPTMAVDLMANRATLDYFHEDILQSVFLTHEGGPHTLALDLVHHETTLLLAEDETVYRHRLHFEVPITHSQPWHLQEATLTLIFIEQLRLHIPLGSVHIYWDTSTPTLRLEALHPLITHVGDGPQQINGVYVRLHNPHTHSVCVHSASPGDPHLEVQWWVTDDDFAREAPFHAYSPSSTACLEPMTSNAVVMTWEDARQWRRFPLVFELLEHGRLERFMVPSFTYQESYLAPPLPTRHTLEFTHGD